MDIMNAAHHRKLFWLSATMAMAIAAPAARAGMLTAAQCEAAAQPQNDGCKDKDDGCKDDDGKKVAICHRRHDDQREDDQREDDGRHDKDFAYIVISVKACIHGHTVHPGDFIATRDYCPSEDLCASVTCQPLNQCHVAGTCDPYTGQCSNPNIADGAACNDGNACTRTDLCESGVCTGTNPVICTASDSCHVSGTCDPSSGICSNPVAANGTACSVSSCGGAAACESGGCVCTCTPGSVLVVGQAGSGNGQFEQPTAVNVDALGNLYVVDSGNKRIQEFDSAGQFLRTFGAGVLSAPAGVAVDASGNIYVTDNPIWACGSASGNNYIDVFNASGAYVTQFVNAYFRSQGAGLAISPLTGNLWVADPFRSTNGCGTGTINQVNPVNGTTVTSEEWHYGISYPSSITVDPCGTVWYSSGGAVYDYNSLVFGDYYPTPLPLSAPTTNLAVSAGSDGNLWISNGAQYNVVEVTPAGAPLAAYGSQGTAPGQFESPAGVVAAGQYVWVSDSVNNNVTRIQASCQTPTKTCP